MTRYLLAALLLAGCGCAQQPIAPEAQSQMSALASSYALAHKTEQRFCTVEHLPQVCIAARTAGRNYEAAYTTAQGERTAAVIHEAELKMIAYQTAVELVF
jgi:hypothetical protein